MKKFIAATAVAFVAFTGSANAATIADRSGLDVQNWLQTVKFIRSLSPSYAEHMVDTMRDAVKQMWPIVSSEAGYENGYEWISQAENASSAGLAEMMVATEIAPELDDGSGHSEVQWLYKAMADATNEDAAKAYVIGIGKMGTVRGVTWSMEAGLHSAEITEEHVEAFLEARGLK